GSQLDRALTPSPQAAIPWVLLAAVPLCSSLAMMVICRPFKSAPSVNE
ncbi:MFS transporter, partial [Pectobacterium brasiliense]|nr:MFS transporter [Pectobacterium brasiliense]